MPQRRCGGIDLIDQGEELYVRAEERQRRRFSEIIAEGLNDPRLRTMMSMRADFFGELQKDEALFKVHRLVNVPPQREAELREVVSRPAALLSARFETDHLAGDIAKRTAEESAKDAGALPLLSYLLDDMWRDMGKREDGVLRLPAQSIDLGRVLVQRADAFIADHPQSEDKLRRIFTLKLATVREDGEPTRRRALRSEFSEEEWRLVGNLADDPNRLVVTAIPEGGGEPYAEVAHEAIFRRWDRLGGWVAAERGFLAWRSSLESARRAWQQAPGGSQNDALLMGLALANAQSWLAKRAGDIPAPERDFIARSGNAAQRRRLRQQALVGVLAFGVVAGLVGWVEHDDVQEFWRSVMVTRPYMQAQVRPYVLTAEAERALKPGDPFRECATGQGKDYCPEMIVIPAGSFMMGSPPTETDRSDNEGPQHPVAIAQPFAVAKFELTFAEWDTCAQYGDCDPRISDSGWGRGRQPVINVSWDYAQRYIEWLKRVTGKPYRLLTEAEYEYAARAGTQTAYPWGDEIGKNNANCDGCGSQWDGRQLAPIGSFAPNQFGLHDMVGNVFESVEDCAHGNYNGAPGDGTAWLETEGGDCRYRVVRGGSWNASPQALRSANRDGDSSDYRVNNLGFRVGRTLTP